MDYIIAVQAAAYPTSQTSFATESAFAEHLKELRALLGERFTRIVLIAPRLSEQEYQAAKDHLGIINSDEHGVIYLPAHYTNTSAKDFWGSCFRDIWKRVSEAVAHAAIVHSGMSDDVWRPLLAIVNLIAWRSGVPVVFVVDLDFRRDTWRFYKSGIWSRKAYIVNRLFYDPLKWIQVWMAVQVYQLVLLKGASMARAFGKGRTNVKNFLDTVHRIEDVLTPPQMKSRLECLRDTSHPLNVVYFGRFVKYKGLDRAIEAVHLARGMGANVVLTLIGDGDQKELLQKQVMETGLEKAVSFHPPVRYGAPLFQLLNDAHLAIATPLAEDTPRASFDAFARGLPLLAFDITFYRDLAENGAVALATWPRVESLAEQLVVLSHDRQRLARMAEAAVVAARENTQAYWLNKRISWTLNTSLDCGSPSKAS
jgi:glycosyltransferase involved in cell wall biosynthesis